MFVKGPINKNKETAAQVSKGLNVFYSTEYHVQKKKKPNRKGFIFNIYLTYFITFF